MPQWNDTDEVEISPKLRRGGRMWLVRFDLTNGRGQSSASPAVPSAGPVLLVSPAMRRRLHKLCQRPCATFTAPLTFFLLR